MPVRSTPYLSFLEEQLSPLGEIGFRVMFGGHCVYCDGIPFALVANQTLFLKADDVNRADLVGYGAKQFRPFDDQNLVMSYYEAPPEIFEDSDAMRRWCGGSVEAGRRAQAKKKPKAKKATKQ